MVRPSSYRRVWLAWSLGICLLGTASSAAESNPRAEQRVASIIDRLSGPSFQDRLNAEDEALQNGDTVLPALQQVQDSQDPELRLRARQLIQRIEQDGLQQSLRAFLAPNSTSELPGWSLVGEIVGDTPENRKYYADLLQAEPQLTQACVVRIDWLANWRDDNRSLETRCSAGCPARSRRCGPQP